VPFPGAGAAIGSCAWKNPTAVLAHFPAGHDRIGTLALVHIEAGHIASIRIEALKRLAMESPEVLVLQASYTNPVHAEAIGFVLNEYAMDAMGGGVPISADTREQLAIELGKRPHAFSVLAFVAGEPVGLVNCFEGFSTFACRPLVNIHDVVVIEKFRGLGISQKMLAKVEEIARQRGCCKLTLEVLEGNEVAQGAYRKLGFDNYQLDPQMGRAMFWQKSL
jgi:ribosomal protein S18 acetylase RimI-like enzyme